MMRVWLVGWWWSSLIMMMKHSMYVCLACLHFSFLFSCFQFSLLVVYLHFYLVDLIFGWLVGVCISNDITLCPHIQSTNIPNLTKWNKKNIGHNIHTRTTRKYQKPNRILGCRQFDVDVFLSGYYYRVDLNFRFLFG